MVHGDSPSPRLPGTHTCTRGHTHKYTHLHGCALAMLSVELTELMSSSPFCLFVCQILQGSDSSLRVLQRSWVSVPCPWAGLTVHESFGGGTKAGGVIRDQSFRTQLTTVLPQPLPASRWASRWAHALEPRSLPARILSKFISGRRFTALFLVL